MTYAATTTIKAQKTTIMKKITLLSLFFLFASSNISFAAWWDCTVHIWTRDMYGLLPAPFDELTIEVEADNRSRAESMAISQPGWYVKSNFWGTKKIYFCPNGYDDSDTYNGKRCNYWLDSRCDCRRQ